MSDNCNFPKVCMTGGVAGGVAGGFIGAFTPAGPVTGAATGFVAGCVKDMTTYAMNNQQCLNVSYQQSNANKAPGREFDGMGRR